MKEKFMIFKYAVSVIAAICLIPPVLADKIKVECEKNAPAHESLAKESIFPGDQEGHEMIQEHRIEQMNCTGVFSNLVEDVIFMHTDQINGTGKHRGTSTYQGEKEEDKVFNEFTGNHNVVIDVEGDWTASWQGEFTIVGGEGKFAAVKGGGRYSGTATANNFTENTEIDVEM